MTKDTFQQASAAFRRHIPDLNIPRFQIPLQNNEDCYAYANRFQEEHIPPWLYNLTLAWKELLEEPFHGVTTDGNVIDELFHEQDEGVEIESIVDAVENVFKIVSPEEKNKLIYPINAKQWRAWSNPEFLLRPFGLRLEDLSPDATQSILAVLKATLSQEGYDKAIAAMRINHFLGEIVKLPKIMNEYSYNFLVFGTPSTTEAWGWSLYGHHLCLSVFLKGRQIIISPFFTGAEPNIIDEGIWAGTEILHTEGNIGLKLMQSLSPELQKKAQIFEQMRDPGMLQSGDLKVDRWNKDDQRHVCGAFRDNRVVPYEGVNATSFNSDQQRLLLDIAEQYFLYLPYKARVLRKEQFSRHFKDTYFCWIGKYGDEDPFYFRVQSPVAIFEFDHHSGVFLNNEEPAKFHTHTILRTPNAGDYGNALRKPEEKVP